MIAKAKRPIPGETIPLVLLLLLTTWILPIAIWISVFRKLTNLYPISGDSAHCDILESSLLSWNFELKSHKYVPRYFYRQSATINSSKKPSLIILVIGSSFYCSTLGSPSDRLKFILCSLLETRPNSSFLFINDEWVIAGNVDLKDTAFVLSPVDDAPEIIQYAGDHVIAEKYGIRNVVLAKGDELPCRLCLPVASFSFISYGEILSVLLSLALRLVTSQWPYSCRVRSYSQFKTQVQYEFKTNVEAIGLFSDIAVRQCVIVYDLLIALKSLLVTCIFVLFSPIL